MPMPPPTARCSRPFEWLELHPDGHVFLCCPAWLKQPLGNLLQQPLEVLWNGPLAREVRKTIHNGSYHRCNHRRCPYLGQGRPFGPVTDPEVTAALSAGRDRLPYPPRVLNLCFDPRCNLTCPSCRRPEPTSAVAAERADQLLARVLNDLAPGAVELRLSGFGEPFAAPAYRQLLQAVGPQRFPTLRRLHLHSNGLLWDAAAWEELANLHSYLSSAEISLDAATPASYAAIRGGDFNRLLGNLEFIAGLGVPLRLSCVVQADNLAELPDFTALAARLGASAYFSQLVNWGTFTRAEYAARAVHRPDHPRHAELLASLRQLAPLPYVELGNLRPLFD